MSDIRRKIKKLEEKPSWVIIENTNYCNISCVFCPHEKMVRKKGFMDPKMFESIIDQCADENIPNVLIQGFGEPLIDKDYVSKVRYAKSRGIKRVHCVTNGILLTQDISKELIDAGLDTLSISIDAASDEVYGRIHKVIGSGKPCKDFDKLVENIRNMAGLKSVYGSDKPYVQVRFKDFDLNKGTFKEFIKLFSRVSDEINVYMNIFNWPGSDNKSSIPHNVPVLKFPCYNLWSTMFIAFDGKVPLCCQDYECSIKIGDLKTQSIAQIWNAEILRRIRKIHLARKFEDLTLCNECDINAHYITPWWE